MTRRRKCRAFDGVKYCALESPHFGECVFTRHDVTVCDCKRCIECDASGGGSKMRAARERREREV